MKQKSTFDVPSQIFGLTAALAAGLMLAAVRADAAALDTNSFAPKFDLPVTGSQLAVAVGDLDGDGRPDLVVANASVGNISIYRNLSTNGILNPGTFGPRLDITVGPFPYSVAVGDIDGDGKLDIIAGINGNGSGNTVVVLRNLSSPGPLTTNSFAAPVSFTVATGPTRIAVGDLDGDGHKDLAVITSQGGGVSVLRNTSSAGVVNAGTFAPFVHFLTGPNSWDVKIGDVDGDGKPDMVAASYNNGTISLLRNISTPGTLATNSFAPKVDISVGTTLNSAIGDLDGDGKADIVVTRYNNSSVSVFRNIGSPGTLTAASFAAPVFLATGQLPRDIALGDVDGDGKPDLLVCDSNDAQLSVLRNTSAPGALTTNSFQPRVTFACGPSPAMGAIADLNGDGRPELIATSFGSSAFSVLRNLIAPSQPPVFTQQPVSQTVPVGDPVVFTASATGGQISYQWYHDNQKLAGETNGSLTLPDVQLAAAGSYWVTASNPVSSVTSSNAVLGVLVPDCTAQPSGLVAWWPAEGNALESLGTNHGTLQNGAGFAAGKIGLALNFDGINDSVRVSASPQLNVGISSGLTLEAWVKPDRLVLGQIAEWNDSFGNTGVHLWQSVDSFVTGDGVGNLYANVVDTLGVSHRITAPSGLLKTNVFQHVALTYDKASGSAVIYYNGIPVKTQNLGIFTPQTTYDLYFGRRASGPFSGDLFVGRIDEVSLYNRALASNEIAAVYGARGAGKCPNLAPIADASATPALVVAPFNCEGPTLAVVALDGSRSSDPDGDSLTYAWFQTGASNAFATGVVATVSLPTGINHLTLVVSDGLASGSQAFTVEVITTATAIERLMATAQADADNAQPLIASLRAALASINRCQPEVAINQLEALKNKILAQVAPHDPALANQLLAEVQVIIDALNGGTAASVALEITSATQGNNGQPHLKIRGSAGRVHIIESSTDMVNWVKVGVAGSKGGCDYEFDDAQAAPAAARFYRVVAPK